ncbi:Uma2 family endonuclease [Chamaesiphon sp. OTE_75_metabat_556]|uniref:Uma2 family endonuclease n=1 Tax=Chamaesiphon sp. OTE_75_metabat_556 TaxID=2964692 RepID=UPI00286CFF58|nr:Uma2 family endonuclease [Chamaesiphon sp. OTE_75_metabat_556]
MYQSTRWKSADLDLLPDNGNRYEIIDGELLVTRAPHWDHQRVITRLIQSLGIWSSQSKLGEVVTTPGIIFTDDDNVIPDLVWISNERLARILDDSGHLVGAPELVVEVLSAGSDNERRDREVKRKLYAIRGVQEYWIVDWQKQQIEIFRRDSNGLLLIATLFGSDVLSSPLLSNFEQSVAEVFS